MTLPVEVIAMRRSRFGIGEEVTSIRHQGLIRITTFLGAGCLGKKVLQDGSLSQQEIILRFADIRKLPVQLQLPMLSESHE